MEYTKDHMNILVDAYDCKDTEELRNFVKEVKILKDDVVSKSRWENIWQLVFEHDGKILSTNYRTGLTEYQENAYFEYWTPEDLKEVVPVTKTIEVTEYIYKESNGLCN